MKNNPGPGDYQLADPMVPNPKIFNSMHSNFKSTSVRKDNLASDPSFPSPTSYNTIDYKGISKSDMQGGSPNNILALQRAENKKMLDTMFPFLVQQRMPNTKRQFETTNLGPGTYSPQDSMSL
jgi:hypothetical protein